MVGSATLTIVKSTMVMKYATTSRVKARQRWLGWLVSSRAAWPTGRMPADGARSVPRTFGMSSSFSICNQ